MSRRIAPEHRREILENTEVLAVIVTDLPVVALSHDPFDNRIHSIAVAGDKPDVLALGDINGISIVAAREAVERLRLDALIE